MAHASSNFQLLVLPSTDTIEEVLEKFSPSILLTKGAYKDIEFIFKDDGPLLLHKGKDLKEFSFVWLSSSWMSRDLAYAVHLYLKHHAVSHTYVEKSTSKITDHMIFSLKNIRTPQTFFVPSADIYPHLSSIKKFCSYPLIIKETKGSRGGKSLLIEKEKDLEKEKKTLPSQKEYFFQRYIANDYDWGVLIAHGKVVSGEKSYPEEGEFRNNVCNGAREVFVKPKDIPQKIQEMAILSVSSLGLSWARADIIIDKNTKEPFLMEVNRLPGLTSKTTEIDGAFSFLSQSIKNIPLS